MLRTRLWMGGLLIALVAGALVADERLAPWFPFLFVLVLLVAVVATGELLQLLRAVLHPSGWLCYAAVMAVLAANWLPSVVAARWPDLPLERDPWHWIGLVFAFVVLAAFVTEMADFHTPGESVARISLAVWITAYLGLLPCFLVQLRWLGAMEANGRRGTAALALAIFVPKCCDIGAYFTGRWLGRHPLAPLLSPKKTWEGAIGGLAAAALAAIGINSAGPVIPGGVLSTVGFGLALGSAGILGDLAESLIKRDCRRKDASQVLPGFGGVLDVIDAILFAAPVAYGWLK